MIHVERFLPDDRKVNWCCGYWLQRFRRDLQPGQVINMLANSDTLPYGGMAELADCVRRRPWLRLFLAVRDPGRLLAHLPDDLPINLWLGVRIDQQDTVDWMVPQLVKLDRPRLFLHLVPRGPLALPFEPELVDRIGLVLFGSIRRTTWPIHPYWGTLARWWADSFNIPFTTAGWGQWGRWVKPAVNRRHPRVDVTVDSGFAAEPPLRMGRDRWRLWPEMPVGERMPPYVIPERLVGSTRLAKPAVVGLPATCQPAKTIPSYVDMRIRPKVKLRPVVKPVTIFQQNDWW